MYKRAHQTACSVCRAELTGDYEDDMNMKTKTRSLGRVGTCMALAVAAGILWSPSVRAQRSAPKYEVDVSWPEPLPGRWILGGLGGGWVDAQDHVVLLDRQDVLDGGLRAGHLAPPVIELDRAGDVVSSWGDLR